MHILDWYHLKKKVNETMTIILSKVGRKIHTQYMLQLLWKGKSTQTIEYLKTLTAKNEEAKNMLITYLTKNKHTSLIMNAEKWQVKPLVVVELKNKMIF